MIYDSRGLVAAVVMTCVDDGMSDEVGKLKKPSNSSAIEFKIVCGNELKATQSNIPLLENKQTP
jgi:hypothetical protein